MPKRKMAAKFYLKMEFLMKENVELKLFIRKKTKIRKVILIKGFGKFFSKPRMVKRKRTEEKKKRES